MVSQVPEYQSIFVSYQDIAQANPGWTDKMIEDYLSLKRDVGIYVGGEGSLEQRVINLELRVDYLESLLPIYVVTAVNHTTTRNEYVLCTAAVTISLNATPADVEQVSIKQKAGNVVIDGNGKLIDGQESVTLRRQYTAPNLVFSEEADEWFIV